MAPSSNLDSLGIYPRTSPSSSSGSLDIIVGSPSSPPPTLVSPRVGQASVDDLQFQMNALSDLLNKIQLRSQAELHYYVQRIQELEMHATHAFEHVSEVQSYIEQKIVILEANLRMAKTNLMEAYEEINRWRELY
ncbi:hypothetical protein TorRG33x02_148760 [Trema orientale]|uniref:Uncharacterized protein n=1 Tax=Trema orientale TaxID=63057 RepID=A0A2P5EUW7_TREOI|nr:hypothetical protein TorRG33x02_148760 [Trema orientale]